MPKIGVPKESLENKAYPLIPAGLYTFRLDGFKPQFSKNKDSVNLMPQETIINHATMNDQRPYVNLNTKAGWELKDFCHSLGVKLEGSDGTEMPGEFDGPQDDPSKWSYRGPLLGQIGQVEIANVPSFKDPSKPVAAVKRYVCRVPGCTEKHSDSLL